MFLPLVLSCIASWTQGDAPAPRELALDDLDGAAAAAGLVFEADELEQMLAGVRNQLAGFSRLRALELANDVPPAFRFDPLLPGMELRAVPVPARELPLPLAARPDDLEELAFADLPTLAGLVRRREVSCVELTSMYLTRLRRLDQSLYCVVSVTEERALSRARELDLELERGHWRGPLHGIPYGAKDLLAARGAPTTWGAEPFRWQKFDFDATVIERLDEAGAVLIAKLSLGSLAMGDEWFRARTRNPWNTAQGSSGSSAGSAAAVVAGGVAFAIGSETLGSIVSPSDLCGASSIRPTFGRVPRHGAMTLSWTMDKLGPMARSVQDAAIVLAAIHGADGRDADAVTRPFAVPIGVDVRGLRVGVPRAELEGEGARALAPVLADLRELGCELVPIDPPEFPVWDLMVILTVEAAAAFDAFTRGSDDDLLVRQGADAWPNLLRVARLIPAVEYLQASRARTRLMRQMDGVFAGVDALVHASRSGPLLGITNLTGHPTVVLPAAPREDGTPTSVSFTGQLYDEARLVALASAWQERGGHHLRRPVVPPPTRTIEFVVVEELRTPRGGTVLGRPVQEVLVGGDSLTLVPTVGRLTQDAHGLRYLELHFEPEPLAALRAYRARHASSHLAIVIEGRVAGLIEPGETVHHPLYAQGVPTAWIDYGS